MFVLQVGFQLSLGYLDVEQGFGFGGLFSQDFHVGNETGLFQFGIGLEVLLRQDDVFFQIGDLALEVLDVIRNRAFTGFLQASFHVFE